MAAAVLSAAPANGELVRREGEYGGKQQLILVGHSLSPQLIIQRGSASTVSLLHVIHHYHIVVHTARIISHEKEALQCNVAGARLRDPNCNGCRLHDTGVIGSTIVGASFNDGTWVGQAANNIVRNSRSADWRPV